MDVVAELALLEMMHEELAQETEGEKREQHIAERDLAHRAKQEITRLRSELDAAYERDLAHRAKQEITRLRSELDAAYEKAKVAEAEMIEAANDEAEADGRGYGSAANVHKRRMETAEKIMEAIRSLKSGDRDHG